MRTPLDMRTPVGRQRRFAPSLTSPWWRAVAGMAAGALPALAFPEPSLWWLAYVALVPWMLIIRMAPTARRAALDGWFGGFGFVIAVHHWLLPNVHVFIVVLGAFLALLWAPWGLLVRSALGGRPSLLRAIAACAVIPAGWLMIEVVRSWQGMGGPWGVLGASQWEVSPALRLASLGGVWLVSLLVVAVNTALTLLIAVKRARIAGTVALVVCAATAASVWAWAPAPQRSGTAARIAIVQPGVVSGPDAVDQRFARSEALTRSLAGQDVDLVVWGESSVGADLTKRSDLAERMAALSRLVGADVLVNVDAQSSGNGGGAGIYKRSVLVGPDGPTHATYDKMRLVPFGEYVPFRSLLGWVTSASEAAGQDRKRGVQQTIMTLPGNTGDLRIGPLVCFETAFPDMSRGLAREGAQVLIAQSSTSTFQQSWAPEQHASLAALRAAETGRSVVHATLTGTSTVYGPAGERHGGVMGTSSSAAAVYEVPLASGTTPYVRFGDWAVYGSLAVLIAYCAAQGVRSLRRQPAQASLEPPVRTARGSATRPGH